MWCLRERAANNWTRDQNPAKSFPTPSHGTVACRAASTTPSHGPRGTLQLRRSRRHLLTTKNRKKEFGNGTGCGARRHSRDANDNATGGFEAGTVTALTMYPKQPFNFAGDRDDLVRCLQRLARHPCGVARALHHRHTQADSVCAFQQFRGDRSRPTLSDSLCCLDGRGAVWAARLDLSEQQITSVGPSIRWFDAWFETQPTTLSFTLNGLALVQPSP
jgi:hypothetical protein